MAAAQRSAATTAAQRRGFFHASAFLMRPFTPVSPKASGAGEGKRRLEAMDKRHRLYALALPLSSTFSSQLISMSRLMQEKASQTRGLNQCKASRQ